MVATYTGSYLHCLLVLSWPIYTTAIDWNGNWAFACDFFNNNIGSVQISGEECGVACEQTPGCTHFTWNPYDGGICWLKGGSVTKDDAYYSDVPGIVCGVVEGNKAMALFYGRLIDRHLIRLLVQLVIQFKT